MTQEHPITPPPELLKHWEDQHFDESENYDVMLIQAYQAGADQELEACCEYLTRCAAWEPWEPEDIQEMRDLRRPKPPSLKKLALETFRSMQIEPVVINGINVNADVMGKYNIIRRALESLPD